jgi:hypothetical protein
VEYSLFMMVAMGEVGEATGGESGSVSPSDLHWNNLFSVFHLSPPPPRKNASEGLYIVILRSS